MSLQDFIPPQSYLFFPKITTGKKEGQRIIFDGNTKFEEYELKVIAQFKAYARKHNYELKSMWTDNLILRFLQANGYKMDKSLVSIKKYTIFRETKLPVKFDDRLEKLLNSNIIYLHGRDKEFRPIIVFNFNNLDPQTIDIELMGEALTYFLEYIVDQWMLPGQIENWIFISNVKHLKLANLAMGSMRKFIGYLQDNYKCRLYKMYIIGATSAMTIPWAIVKNFLDGDTVNKVEFYKTQVPEGLFTHANRDQVEQRFGGNAPNVVTYWPPNPTPNNYFVKEEDNYSLMSKEEYINSYKNGLFKNIKVSSAILNQQVEQTNQQDTCKSQEIINNSYMNPTETPDSKYPNTQSVRGSIKEDLLDQEEEGIDYMGYMCEKNDRPVERPAMKEFEANFIDYLRMAHAPHENVGNN